MYLIRFNSGKDKQNIYFCINKKRNKQRIEVMFTLLVFFCHLHYFIDLEAPLLKGQAKGEPERCGRGLSKGARGSLRLFRNRQPQPLTLPQIWPRPNMRPLSGLPRRSNLLEQYLRGAE